MDKWKIFVKWRNKKKIKHENNKRVKQCRESVCAFISIPITHEKQHGRGRKINERNKIVRVFNIGKKYYIEGGCVILINSSKNKMRKDRMMP